MNFTVPSGNFGNVFAGYAARKMGLPIDWLGVGSNRNDILFVFEQNDMSSQVVEPSLAPSMDIQVSSNFERLLFDLCQGDGALVAKPLPNSANLAPWPCRKGLMKKHGVSSPVSAIAIEGRFCRK